MQITEFKTKIIPTSINQTSSNHQTLTKMYQTFANHHHITSKPNQITKNQPIKINASPKRLQTKNSIDKGGFGIGIGNIKSNSNISKDKDDFLYKIDMNLLRQENADIDKQTKKPTKSHRAFLTVRNFRKEREQKKENVVNWQKQILKNYKKKLSNQLQNQSLNIMKYLKQYSNQQNFNPKFTKIHKQKFKNQNKFSLFNHSFEKNQQTCLPSEFAKILNIQIPRHSIRFKQSNFISKSQQEKIQMILKMSTIDKTSFYDTLPYADSFPIMSKSFLQ